MKHAETCLTPPAQGPNFDQGKSYPNWSIDVQ